ncbi:hypothetical protein LSCM1_04344 [Leishmania martiniquensis]|uniref:Ankyrin repeat protein n=1 Tax=Leishmania martiniquensis TaxID=1580590 RepID=A0A836GHE1_9TRYP|nr:hypothetical protein LSCM1_04344 [Leishmania martiniquensis]
MGKQRWHSISPELRGIAHAVSSADIHQFPDLAPVPGHTHPPVSALRRITTELNDAEPLSNHEFKLFRTAYEECRQRLHCVTNGAIASGTPFADVLLLVIRMDSLCSDLGLSLLAVFPALQEIHTYLLDLGGRLSLSRDEWQRQGVLLDRLARFLHGILDRGERALRDYEAWETQRDTSNPDRGAPAEVKSTAASSAAANSPCEAARGQSAGDRHLENVATSGSALAFCLASPRQSSTQEFLPAAASRSEMHRAATNTMAVSATAADALEFIPLSARHRLPRHVVDTIASVNADVAVHFAHIRWYVKVTDQAPFSFDAHSYLEDHGLQAAWDIHVGRKRSACTAEEFLPILPLFPPWARTAVMSVLNFKDCGVISLYSLQRLLSVWGPIQLLEENLRHELERGAVELSEPFAYLAFSLAARPDAVVGDYVAGLTETVGELRVAVLRRVHRHHRHVFTAAGAASFSPSARTRGGDGTSGMIASPAHTAAVPRQFLAAVSFTLCNATGAWMIRGLARTAFESVTDAYSEFSEIFRRPCGQSLGTFSAALPRPASATIATSRPLSAEERFSVVSAPLRAANSAMPEDLVEGSTSALHRACYRNNSRYVRTLLLRGSGTVINVALVDRLMCDNFCWTPLLYAVNNPHGDPAELVSLLLEAGAEVEYMDEAECTALYYAIANGYAETTRLLLKHCPTLSTSPYTVPLLVAIGAHEYHRRESDVWRLMEVVPNATVLRVVVAYESSHALVALASTILEAKLNDKIHCASPAERHLVEQRCPGGAGRYTPAEEQQLKSCIHHHTHCCLRARQDVEEAVRVLYARQYALSWRAWLDALDAAGRGDAAAASGPAS